MTSSLCVLCVLGFDSPLAVQGTFAVADKLKKVHASQSPPKMKQVKESNTLVNKATIPPEAQKLTMMLTFFVD